jgi:hypothetical protein
MKIGDLVVILGKLDERVRKNLTQGLVIGTLDQMYGDQATVLLPDGEIWTGPKRDVRPAGEQQ